MILDRFRLEKRVAVVTGATKGIGEAVTFLALAETGAPVSAARPLRENDHMICTANIMPKRAFLAYS